MSTKNTQEYLVKFRLLPKKGEAFSTTPFDQISLEMIYRGLYHFYVAHQKGLASDPIKYFSAPENQDLGIVKRQRGTKEFFFQAPSKIPLKTGLQP